MINMFEQYTNILAGEGIPVIYDANAPTAMFNMESREIIVPTFEYLDVDTTQLLISHEIGHARNTTCTLADFEKYTKKYGDIFNIVEDVYIERKMKEEFPGLKTIFKSGYKSLHANNFFGDFKFEDLDFPDKLNIMAKIGHCLMETKFDSAYEYDIANRLMAVSSREEVISLCDEILAYIGEENKKDSKKSSGSSSNGSSGGSADKSSTSPKSSSKNESGNDSNNDSNGDSSTKESVEDGDGDKSVSGSSSAENDEKNNSAENSEQDDKNNSDKKSSPYTSKTSKALKDAMEKFGKKEVKENNTHVGNYGTYIINSIDNKLDKIMYSNADIMNKIGTFYLEQKKSEFECKAKIVKLAAGAADAIFQRKVSAKAKRTEKNKKTGSIDSRKLVNYKTRENIFKSLKIQTNQVNHGVVILVDYSGSMSTIINEVLMQAAIAAEFCKKNNIPFVVIAYGTNIYRKDYACMKLADSLSYKLENILGFYAVSSKYDISMGNTPMDSGIMCGYEFLKSYKMNGVDKTVLFVITDGDYHKQLKSRVGYTTGNKNKVSTKVTGGGEYKYAESIIFDGVKTSIKEINHINKNVEVESNQYEGYMDCLFRHIKKTLDSTIIFSFLYPASLKSFKNIYAVESYKCFVTQVILANNLSMKDIDDRDIFSWKCNEKYLDKFIAVSYENINKTSSCIQDDTDSIMTTIARDSAYKKLLSIFAQNLIDSIA